MIGATHGSEARSRGKIARPKNFFVVSALRLTIRAKALRAPVLFNEET